jgi:hypothetical protein
MLQRLIEQDPVVVVTARRAKTLWLQESLAVLTTFGMDRE